MSASGERLTQVLAGWARGSACASGGDGEERRRTPRQTMEVIQFMAVLGQRLLCNGFAAPTENAALDPARVALLVFHGDGERARGNSLIGRSSFSSHTPCDSGLNFGARFSPAAMPLTAKSAVTVKALGIEAGVVVVRADEDAVERRRSRRRAER